VQFDATVAPDQLNVVLELVVAEADSPAGVLGTVVHELQAPSEVHGCPLPGPPLLVAGFCPCVHQFAT
jgi:hypothetical protein